MVERIMEMTSENLNIDRALIQPTSSFKGDLGIDSLDLLEIITELEDRLDIDFGEPEGLQNVGDLVNYLETL